MGNDEALYTAGPQAQSTPSMGATIKGVLGQSKRLFKMGRT